jgi:hypothetical protein
MVYSKHSKFRGEELRGEKYCGGKAAEIPDRQLYLKGCHRAFRPRVLFLENAPAETL